MIFNFVYYGRRKLRISELVNSPKLFLYFIVIVYGHYMYYSLICLILTITKLYQKAKGLL